MKIAFLVFFITITSYPQNNERKLLNNEKNIAINTIGKVIKGQYIFPETAENIVKSLKKALKNKKYFKISDFDEFAITLTNDLRTFSGDKHFKVIFDPKWVANTKTKTSSKDSLEFLRKNLLKAKKENFGFKELKILDGNIGYLNLTKFDDTNYASETAIAALNLLKNTDALIVDLRNNGGGHGTMVQLITSYFFNSEPRHLNSYYWRETNSYTQSWTLPYVPGVKQPKTPIYVLVSKFTFSAAEEFSYNLQNLKRATIIGEKTGGGAHPIDKISISENFILQIPIGRAINPITNSNWEGNGVIPDIETSSNDAYLTAYIKALEDLKDRNSNNNFVYDWSLATLKSKKETVTVDKATLLSYVGKYGPRNIYFENSDLFYQRKGGNKYQLRALSSILFAIDEIPYFRIKFLISKDNKVKGLIGLYQNGTTDQNIKDW